MALTEGVRIGPYQIVSLLGRGGMGEVYRAHDARLGRDVAIKVLAPGLANTPDAVARFEREARAVAALNHPNIVSLHDVGHDGDLAYAVTELLEGETLRDLLVRSPRAGLRQALDIAIQVARGVGAAHARGIVHRDLKPENLFLTTDRRVKVLDFGLARRAPLAGMDTIVETSPGVVVGTVGYMAPEVVRGEPATTASDVFAFGVLLQEMLAGSHPFAKATPADTLTAIMRDDPPRLARVAPAVPTPLARLVERCLQKMPADRPESMRDVAFYLENVDTSSGGLPLTGSPATSTAAGGPASRRAPLPAIAAAVTALTVATVGLLWWVERQTPTGAGDDADPAAVVAQAQDQRMARLGIVARAVASVSNLKALIETNDAPTVAGALEGYRDALALPEPPVLAALTPDGRLLARTGGSVVAGVEESAAWQQVLAAERRSAVITIGGRPYHAVGALAEAAGTVFGGVVAALPVDDRFAGDVRNLTQHDVVLLDAAGSRGSTLVQRAVPWGSLAAWREAGGGPGSDLPVSIGGVVYRAREVSLASTPALSAVLMSPPSAVAIPWGRLRIAVIVVGALVLALAALVLRQA
jgi:hypothetical protein